MNPSGNKVLFVYHHLGMGDHIICNGLVRELSDRGNKINLFVLGHNYESVKFMYRDIDMILITVKNDNEVIEYLKNNKITSIIKIGFDKLITKDVRFDQAFYRDLDIDFKLRWDKFIVKRDYDKEDNLYNKYKLEEKNYIFIHDDKTRNYSINEKYISNKKIKIVRPIIGLTNNIFDYCKILENAAEIHCMDSSFKLLADSLYKKANSMYYHIYVRGNSNNNVSNSKYKWELIYSRYPVINNLKKLLEKD